jgi:tRNA 2-selenouridine synthase
LQGHFYFGTFAPMPIRRHPVSEFLQLAKGQLIFDVRSPGEFGHAFMPGALPLPLFSDEERKQVGTAYKQVSREQAIKIGLDAFGPKMRRIVEEVEEKAAARGLPAKCPVYLYCWRGGMRSGAVAWLLDLYGFEVHVLAGGYKAFRNYVLDTFTLELPYHILGGYTGSGKTELLHRLKELGETVIDLEGLAGHKGSAFGNIDRLPQPTQEMFENLLAMEVRSSIVNREPAITANEGASTGNKETLSRLTIPDSRIWLEDESQRIGQLHIPHTLWAIMRRSPVYFVEIPFEQRLKHIVEEYGVLDRARLREAIERISKRLGGLDTKMALQFIDEGNIHDCFAILLRYYDKFYLKGLHNREALSGLLHTFECSDVDPENARKLIS